MLMRKSYEVNMWGKYCKIYPECATKNSALFKRYNQDMKIDCLIAQDKMKNRFNKIKCTAASVRVWVIILFWVGMP